jgi:hypothetical protein
MVAKPLRSAYKPGDRRAWLKVKNRAYWKYELERESAIEGRTNRNARGGTLPRSARRHASASRPDVPTRDDDTVLRRHRGRLTPRIAGRYGSCVPLG